MIFVDTGMNASESEQTLLFQQQRLIAGKRLVQMFPNGTTELPLPKGMKRIVGERGIFHYNPKQITKEEILKTSAAFRENEFLELGPYNKQDVLNKGENLLTVMETTKDGQEVRSALSCPSLLEEQYYYFEKTKDPDNMIVCVQLPERVLKVLDKGAPEWH